MRGHPSARFMARLRDPTGVQPFRIDETARLRAIGLVLDLPLQRGPLENLKKIGEEATEVVIAACSESDERLASKIADLVFHLSALLVDADMDWSDVGRQLAARAR